ncbi:spermidine resistance protein, variant 2 [Bonamia ostreae]|uniref:Spermidine resistance protein, variant 2 n=1 Tax=Bonamia ostreae TaxID=126728 RepID=A0ABV2ANG1_9EUKA
MSFSNCANLKNIESENFEGSEKKLEIKTEGTDLRLISNKKWEKILRMAKCQILSHVSNDFVEAYILSESALFVFQNKMILKTCGTTPLLICIPNFESERKFLERFFSGKIFVTDTKQEPIFYLYFAQIRPYFPKNEQTVEMNCLDFWEKPKSIHIFFRPAGILKTQLRIIII